MFKIFTGYALVEKYHNWKKSHKTDDKTVSRLIRLAIAVVACLLVWCLPVENWIDGMTLIQKRTLAIFLFAILMWLFEAVPAWTTSVMVVVLLLFTTSNSSLVFFENSAPEALGAQTSYNGVFNSQSVQTIGIFYIGVSQRFLNLLRTELLLNVRKPRKSIICTN